jgi:two-component system, OmpR family, response regulator
LSADGDRDRAEHAPSVLVAEHDERVARPLVEQLVADGYHVRLGRTAEHARVLARSQPPRIVLLGELDTPRSALELLLEIRGGGLPARDGAHTRWPVALPVIVISHRTAEADLLRAFDAGADDFLARPPRYLEVRARLRALLLRTAGGRGAQRVEVGPLAIDLDVHAASLHGRPLRLRRLEYELLVHLAREPQRVFAKGELLRAVWGYHIPVSTRTLDSHSSRLRRKLRAEGEEQWVVNVRGVGYRLI